MGTGVPILSLSIRESRNVQVESPSRSWQSAFEHFIDVK